MLIFAQLLLVLWKSILTCCGGIRELHRVKKLSRELAGLGPVPDEGTYDAFIHLVQFPDLFLSALPIKASPLDIEAFHQEITVKYPTFAPHKQHDLEEIATLTPAPIPIPTSKLAEAYSPIPIRHHYEHDDHEPSHHGMPLSHPHGPQYHPHQAGSGFRMPHNATPAPSPPPSPKPKKQQFQTDQTRPFLFPFSRTQMGRRGGSLVPFAIDEADKLYHRHMYVSLSLWQMWRTREECMTAESGLERMPGTEKVFEPKVAPNVRSLISRGTCCDFC